MSQDCQTSGLSLAFKLQLDNRNKQSQTFQGFQDSRWDKTQMKREYDKVNSEKKKTDGLGWRW